MPRLLRRRQVWLPTLWGWLALLVVAVPLVVVLARNANGFFALNEPALGPDGKGARTLVVEGWLAETDLDQAVAAFRRGRYERVLTSGGPLEAWGGEYASRSYAERAADYLKHNGLADIPVTAVPAPASKQDRTYLSAVMIREWTQRAGIRLDAIDLFSSGVHARRSRLMYRLALGDAVEVGVLSARPASFDAERWWSSSQGAKLLMGETISLVWTTCCFWPAAPGSHEERWGKPAAPSTESAHGLR